MDKLEIIKVKKTDILQLQTISKQTFYDTFSSENSEENMSKYLDEKFSIETLTSELTNNNSVFYFASLTNHIIGYLKINFGQSQTELQAERAIEIERIYVLKTFHGSHVGQDLIEKVIEISRRKKVKYIWLGVWEENLRAIRFYEKNGFIAFGKHIFKLGDDEQTDIMMKLILINND